MDIPTFYAGRLLLAMPGIGDPNFDHSAILLCAHDAEGAMGLDIGTRVEGLTLHGLLDSFDIDASAIADRPLVRGGPVEPQRGFVLHTRDWGGQDSLMVDGPDGMGWALSGSLDILKAIAAGRGPSHYVVGLGYSGWGPGQLENEMTRHGWFLADPSDGLLFDTRSDRIWSAAFAASGIDSALLSVRTGTA